MNELFETIIKSYLKDNIGLTDTFLSKTLSAQLKNKLLTLFNQNQFQIAGIGNHSAYTKNNAIRSDIIYWLDKKHNDAFENMFFDVIDAFVKYINETCYTGILDYEFHYAFYQAGSFYKRHLDQFKSNGNRAYSMIMYLNDEWQDGDGGELCVYHPHHEQLISPLNCRCVFFKSNQLEHEVLLSHKPRMSITGWFKTT